MSDITQKTSAQNQAIHDYLQSLLLEVPEEDDTAPELVTQLELTPVLKHDQHHEVPLNNPPVVGLDQLVAEVPDVITRTVTETVTETDVDISNQVQMTEIQQEPLQPVKNDSGVPEWAETRFQCLLFKVSGLSLAVPLVKLNSVIPWDENITETPNKTQWYLGLVQHLQNQVKVIDTALLVMPENRHENLRTESEDRLSHILLVDDYQWGLACSSIGDVIWLNQDEVKWRKNKTSRSWLSGTSLEHLCAIMDTEVFAKMLTESG
jgi:purine-binding chemotaxis protein CheW